MWDIRRVALRLIEGVVWFFCVHMKCGVDRASVARVVVDTDLLSWFLLQIMTPF